MCTDIGCTVLALKLACEVGSLSLGSELREFGVRRFQVLVFRVRSTFVSV